MFGYEDELQWDIKILKEENESLILVIEQLKEQIKDLEKTLNDYER